MMKAIFLPANDKFHFTDSSPQLLSKTLINYTTEILKQSNIPLVDRIPTSGRVVFLYGNMALLQTKSLLMALETVAEGYIKDEFVCMYWTNASRGAMDIEALEEKLTEIPYTDDFLVIDSPRKLALGTKLMKNRINNFWLDEGIYIMDPDNTYIGNEVILERGVIIHPNCHIYGKTTVGQQAVIGPNTSMNQVKIGQNSQVNQSEIHDSTLGAFSMVGPFAYIRPGSQIGDHVKIGNFVEIKNSTIGNHTKASHLSYIGDADLGQAVNVGCGTVVINFDGKKKHRSLIRDNVFIGCNSKIISPVEIGENSVIAAGSTITDSIPPNSFAIARSRQTTKKDYLLSKDVSQAHTDGEDT